MYDAVLWDIDGTLIDTTALITGAMGETFRHFAGREVPKCELCSLIGMPLETQLVYLGDPASFGTSVQEMSAFFVEDYERRHDQERVIDVAVEALIELKRQGVKTAIVTSKNDVELANTLPRLGISVFCDVIVGSDQSAPFFKPHPRPVTLALEYLEAEAQKAIFIGDTVYDIRCGRAAGVQTAAVLWGAGTEVSLRFEEPDLIFSHAEEILPSLGQASWINPISLGETLRT